MKNILLLTNMIFLLFSCNKKEEETKTVQKTEKEFIEDSFSDIKNETLENWIAYYKTNVDSTFTIEKFKLTNKSEFSKSQGNIFGIFDKEFNEIYTDFLIYSPNKQNYVDIDSYQWYLDEENKTEVLFEIDQEINLVNIPTKKIERIGFRGSQGWIEDAYWKNDSIIVLLETTVDKIPIITEMNLHSNESLTFTYQDTLKEVSDFSKKRIVGKLDNDEMLKQVQHDE